MGKMIPAVTHLQKIPPEISYYIQSNFGDNCLIDVKTTLGTNKKPIFNVDVSHDNTLYHLEFNSIGTLLKKEMEPLLELYDEDTIDMD